MRVLGVHGFSDYVTPVTCHVHSVTTNDDIYMALHQVCKRYYGFIAHFSFLSRFPSTKKTARSKWGHVTPCIANYLRDIRFFLAIVNLCVPEYKR